MCNISDFVNFSVNVTTSSSKSPEWKYDAVDDSIDNRLKVVDADAKMLLSDSQIRSALSRTEYGTRSESGVFSEWSDKFELITI